MSSTGAILLFTFIFFLGMFLGAGLDDYKSREGVMGLSFVVMILVAVISITRLCVLTF